MNALTLAVRLVKLGFIPGTHFIGNGDDVVMAEAGARSLGIYSGFYFHSLSEEEQKNAPLHSKRTLEEEIGYAEKGAKLMDTVGKTGGDMMHDHSLGRLKEWAEDKSPVFLTPHVVPSEPIVEQIYSTKHLEQPTGRHPDLMSRREVDMLILGIDPGQDSVLTSEVRTDRDVTKVRAGVGKTREIDTTKGGVELARKLVDMTPGWYRSAPKPEPTGRTVLGGNRFTGESERRYPHGHPLDYLIGELHALLAIGDKNAILEYYREYLGTRDKPLFLRLRRAQQVRAARRALAKMLVDTRETRRQSIEKVFGLKPNSFGG